jgi:hypothetical protein
LETTKKWDRKETVDCAVGDKAHGDAAFVAPDEDLAGRFDLARS